VTTTDNDAQPYVKGLTFEEMPPGMKARTAGRTILEADLAAFVNLVGMHEPLFLDAEHASAAGYAGRLCPGAMTYGFAEGLVIQTHMLHGTGLAAMSADLSVKGPTYVGDTLHVVIEVLESRPASKGARGIVTTRNTVRNQRGEDVLVWEAKRLIRGKDYEPTTG
jgi:acyl dehydratase